MGDPVVRCRPASTVSMDVAGSCERSGASFVVGHARSLDPAARRVRLEDGRELGYDLVSFNVGSRTAGADDPGVRAHALTLKPFDRVRDVRRRIEELASAATEGAARVVVVGAGAAGVEVACACDVVLARAGRRGRVTLLEASQRILPGYSDRVVALAERVLRARGIHLRKGARVAAVEAGRVVLRSGESLDAELTAWLVGTTALDTFAGSGLPLDDRGFLLVDGALRSVADERVFAVGDCATQADHRDTPKAGVFAVRQAPILWRNLAAMARTEPPPARYRPQRGFLSLLNTCDGRAILRYRGVTAHARWAWWLKDAIDRGFMRRYQRA